MLKVLPVQTKTEQEALCKMCNIVYRPELLMYAATYDGEFMGVCQFKTSDKGGLIYDIAKSADKVHEDGAHTAKEFEALFVMGRGALNFIDLCGVHNATYVGEATDDKLLRAIGFSKKESGEYSVDLNGFFTDHCH